MEMSASVDDVSKHSMATKELELRVVWKVCMLTYAEFNAGARVVGLPIVKISGRFFICSVVLPRFVSWLGSLLRTLAFAADDEVQMQAASNAEFAVEKCLEIRE
jgi:hypothetical protein